MRIYVSNMEPVDFPKAPSVLELAEKLFPKKTSLVVGAYINDSSEISDLRTLLQDGNKVRLVFIPSKEALEVVRHSSAHVMAQAVQELWPKVKVTIGPVIEDGFYYDFESPKVFRPEDLETIEHKMQEIINRKLEVKKEVWPKDKAISVFQKMGEHYKVEIVQELEESEVSVYRQGEWLDLCRGPHVKNLSQIGAVKLLKLSGAYWRGDESKAQLQRIYGTAFHSQKEVKQHLHNLEEAGKRDHRKLGKELGLFYFSDLSPGSPFFAGAGACIYNELKFFLRQLYVKYSYEEVITPQVFNGDLYTRTGHIEHFSENMYAVNTQFAHSAGSAVPAEEEVNSTGDKNSKNFPKDFSPKKHDKINKEFFLKPMNCPGHCVLYSFKKHSYRELPWRVADFGRLHRNEKKGALHGLTRVTSMCQDDAHIFCMEEQIKQEVKNLLKMFQEVYSVLGLKDYKVALSTRPEQFMGEPALWDQAEKSLEEVLKELKISFEIQPGEGAFYGPKLDLNFVDAMKRGWQLGTVQCDFNMPKAFGLKYTARDNTDKTPVLLHRAVLGSLERFIGVYLEHTAGFLPLWLAPRQVVLINVSKNQESYTARLEQKMKHLSIKAHADLRSEKLGYKMREARLLRVPCIVVVGDKETAEDTLSVRLRSGVSRTVKKEIFIQHIVDKIGSKALNWEEGLPVEN